MNLQFPSPHNADITSVPFFFLAVGELLLYRYLNPTKDSRALPPVPTGRLSKLCPTDKFLVDASVGSITISIEGGGIAEVGDKLVYTDTMHPLN